MNPASGTRLITDFLQHVTVRQESSELSVFCTLLRDNRNYRYTWLGQVVSEIGDHFNNIAVFSLALDHTKSGLVVTGVMLARAVPAVIAGPISGVLLDRLDRRRVMMASDLVRFVVALGFILCIHAKYNWMLYAFSGLLMFASPFFTSGRSSILPSIATEGRTAHGKLTDTNHAMEHAHYRHHAAGLSVRNSVTSGHFFAMPCRFWFPRCASPCCACLKDFDAEAEGPERDRGGAALA